MSEPISKIFLSHTGEDYATYAYLDSDGSENQADISDPQALLIIDQLLRNQDDLKKLIKKF